MKHIILLLMMLWALICPSVFAQTGFDYELDESRPLINDVEQLSSPWNAPHAWEGDLEHLLDGDPETYWHTNWNDNTHKHYLQVALSEPVYELISLKFTRRWHKYNSTVECTADHVTKWSVYGSDDPEAADDGWVELLVTETPYNRPGETINTIGFDTKGKQYLRLYAESTNSGNKWWHAAEIQLYPCELASELTAALKELEEVYFNYETYYYTFQDNAGTAPGQYTPETVDAFVAALDQANEIIDGSGSDYTADDVKALSAAIKAAYQAVLDSEIPFTLADGYYRLRHGVVFMNDVATGDVDANGNPVYEFKEVHKYMYTTVSGGKIIVRWHTPDFDEVLDNCPALWKVTNKDGLFDIVNCATDARFDNWVSSPLTMSTTSENLIAADLMGNVDGEPQVALRVSTQDTRSYFHPLNHKITVGAGFGTGTGDVIIGWANDASRVSEWVFEPVSDAEAAAIIESYEPYKDQAQLVDKFKEMLADAKEKLEIAKDLSMAGALITSVSQLSSPWNAPHSFEGNLAHLIDDDPLTYWHTTWNNTTDRHYLQVALNEPVHELVCMRFARRMYQYNSTNPSIKDHVTKWSIWGSDDPEAEEEDWELLAEFDTPYTEPGEVIVTDGFDTNGKQYLRIYGEETNQGSNYWHVAELQLYPSPLEIIDPPTSQFHVMGSIGTALDNVLTQLSDIDPETVTVEQYTQLKQAYDPFIAKFVDPTALRNKIVAVTGADDIVAIGTQPGFWKDDSASNTLAQAIADAKAYDEAGAYTTAKSEAQIANLDAAVANIKASAIPVQTGKWYRIRFGTEEEYAEHNWNTVGNETQYRTVDGEPTDIVINEGNFGHYMTVARLDATTTEDADGSYTQNFIVPVDKEEVTINDQLYGDALEDIENPDMALFRFISLGDSAYIIQNKATGLYLQKKVEDNDGIYLSVHPSLFTQEVVGYGQNAFFIKTLSNEAQNPLHFARNKNVVITWGHYGDTDGRRGCFYVEEVEDVASDYAENTARIGMWDGTLSARCFPVSMKAVYETQGVMWTVTSVTRQAATDDTPAQVTVNLAKLDNNEAAAGRPFVYVKNGDYVPQESLDEGAEPELVEFTFGSEIVGQPQNDGALKGVFSRTTVGEGVLTANATTFVRSDASNTTVNTDYAYIADDEPFQRGYKIELNFDGTQDGLATVLQKVARGGEIYTLDGRLITRQGNINDLNGLQPGIYIVGGVKVVVK